MSKKCYGSGEISNSVGGT